MISKSKILILFLLLISLSMASVSASDVGDGAIQTGNSTLDGIIASDEVNQDIAANGEESNILDASPFSDLQTYIDESSEGSIIYLHNNYSLGSGGNTISISKSITLDGNGYTLSGDNVNRIINLEADGKSVVFRNVIFKYGAVSDYGGAIFNNHSSSLSLINCQFNDNIAKIGGAVSSVGDIFVVNSTFTYNKADLEGGAIYCKGKTTIKISDFIENDAVPKLIEGYGGAISSVGDCDIDSCIFDSNHARNGGAVYCYGNLFVDSTYKKSTFLYNRAQIDGGAVYCNGTTTIKSSEFYHNSVESDLVKCSGGAVYSRGKCDIDSTYFHDNYADTFGGAVYAENDLNITNDTVFTQNLATGSVQNYGGAIYCKGNAYIADAGFYRNRAGIRFLTSAHIDGKFGDGGAIYIEGRCHIDSCKFDKNFAAGYGGAISTNGACLNITGQTRFRDNEASDMCGGAINCFGGDIYINWDSNEGHCDMISNNAQADGGAIACEGNLYAQFLNCDGNKGGGEGDAFHSGGAGAIWCRGETHISSSVFSNNEFYVEDHETWWARRSIPGDGGAIYSVGKCYIDSCSFTGNYAERGGAIFAENDLTVTGKTNFTNNRAGIFWDGFVVAEGGAIKCLGNLFINDANFSSNRVDFNGGAIFCAGDTTVYNSWFNNNFCKNWVEDDPNDPAMDHFGAAICSGDSLGLGGMVTVINCTFDNNWANDRAGAIYSNKGVKINNCNFTKNYASSDFGGAIYIADECNSEIVSCRFEGHWCPKDGGVIYLNSESSHLKVTDSTFKDNHAYGSGGAVYCNGQTTISDSIFKNNSAIGGYGGAIRSIGLISVDNSEFNDNSAYSWAGAIYAALEITIIDSNFSGNSAKDAGAVYTNKIINKGVSNSIFNNNNAAEGKGGAIYVKDRCNPDLNSCRFENNACHRDGGAIYLYSSNTGLTLSFCTFAGNKAGADGGAIFTYGETFIHDSKFDANVATGATNERSFGGAIRSKGLILVENCNFENNVADISHNKGSFGGAIYADKTIMLSKSNSFVGNSAKTGGAIYTSTIDCSYGPVSKSIFLHNKATDGDGGAIYINNLCNVGFVSCRFENNDAYNRGGAIYADSTGTDLTISYCTFVDNYANKTDYHRGHYCGAGHSVFISGHYNLIDMCWFGRNKPDFNEQFVKYHLGKDDEDYIPKNYLTISMIINDTDIYLGNTYEVAVHLSAINHKPLEKDLLHSNGLINTFDGNCSHGALGCNDITADVSFNRENPLLFGRLDHEAVTLRLNVKSKAPSEVRILSCEDIVYPDTFKVTYEIVNWTNPVYVLKDSKGKVVRGGAITSPDTLVVDHLLTVGSYSITITNPESSTVDSSNATANFRVLRQVNGTVTADNVVYGNPTTITLKTTTNGLYNVVIDDLVIEMEVNDGICVKQVMLNAGEYQTHTIGLGLVALNCSEASFTVSKAVPLFKLNVSSHEFIYGDEVFVNHTLTSNATGYIAYYLNNEKYANLSVNDSLNLSGLDAGSYMIDAVYSGDSNYCSANDSVAVKVNPIPNNAAVSVDDITYGEDALIEVFADVDGEYSVDVNGTLVTVSVNNGVGNKSIRLDAGNYYANVTFNNKNYNTSSKNATFSIYKADILLSVVVLDEVYPQDVEATVYASRDGMYNLTVAGYSDVVTVKNGLAYINAGVVDAGTHEAFVSFNGDRNYNFAKNSTKFVVNASGTLFEIEINPSEITYGETADVTHTLSDGATGNISYYLLNGTFLGELPVGEHLTLPILDVGYYVVVADYLGDRDFMPASDIAFITVGPALNSVRVSADEVTYGMESVIEISADVDGTYQLDINGTVYNVTVKNGAGNKTIALDAGSYYANATFGDDNYVTQVKNTTFVVNKARNNVVVIVGNVTYGEITIVEVFADVDGTYQVDVNGTVYNVTVNDGIGEKSISLDAGSYYANATFGDENYATVSKNATFSVYKACNNLLVVAFNTTYPYDVEGIVYADVDGEYNLTVGIYSTSVVVNNGVGEFNAGLFDAGEYLVVVDYPGDLNHKSNSSSTNVTVDKFAPDVSLYVSNFDYGDVGVIMITCDVPGSINVTVNGITETLDLNGQSKDVLFATFTNILRAGYDAELSLYNLNAGHYPVSVVYNGDKNFESVKASGEFTVNALNVTMGIDAGDVSVGDDEIITVSLPSDVDGNVTVTVEGRNYTEPVKDGKAVITLSNLAAGTKKAIVYYSGDLNHNPAMSNVSFTVNKLKADMSAVNNNPNSGEMVHIVVSLPGDATGTVTIAIDGKDYTAPVENGKAVFNIPGLDAGEYGFTAYYSGDDRYSPANVTGTINVTPNKDKNKTIDHPRGGGVVLSDYPTGNPLLILLALMATGFVIVRRFGK